MPYNNKSRIAQQTLHLIQNQSWWCEGNLRLNSELVDYLLRIIEFTGWFYLMGFHGGRGELSVRLQAGAGPPLEWSVGLKRWTALGWWLHCALVLEHSQLISLQSAQRQSVVHKRLHSSRGGSLATPCSISSARGHGEALSQKENSNQWEWDRVQSHKGKHAHTHLHRHNNASVGANIHL